MADQQETVLKTGGNFFLRCTDKASYDLDAPIVHLTLTNKQLIIEEPSKEFDVYDRQGVVTYVSKATIPAKNHLSLPLSSIVEVNVSGFALSTNLNIRYRKEKDSRIFLAWLKSASGLPMGPKEWAEAIKNALKNVKRA